MFRRLLSDIVVSAVPRMDDDKHTVSSRHKLRLFTSVKSHLTAINDDPQAPTQPPTTDNDDPRVPTQPLIISDDDLRVPTPSTMPSRLSQNEDEANDPHMADSWSLEADADLKREYTLIDTDPTSEHGYDVIPDPKATIVEKNPKKPPHALDYYAEDRSYTRKLAERMNYWVTDLAARLSGGKQCDPDKRSDEDKATQKKADDAAWVDNVKHDIQCLWNNMGVGQDLLDKELQHFREVFFFVCRQTLEKIEEEGHGVSFARFQTEVRTLLVHLNLKLSEEGIRIMKAMATDKQVLQKQHSFTFEEQREINSIARHMMGRLREGQYDMLRENLLSKMAPEQKEIFCRQKLDPVRRYFNNCAIKKFANDKKKQLEEDLKVKRY